MHGETVKLSDIKLVFHFSINFLSLISKFRRVLHVVCFLLGDSPAFEFIVDWLALVTLIES
jgi:hypothetical protein